MQDYQRRRADHLIGAASQVQKMQQALERMNIKFHDVISDLVGVSGLKVVRAILQGERRPGELLALGDVQIQKQKADRVKESLRGGWKKEQLFALRQGLELWETYQQKIADCDRELAGLLQEMVARLCGGRDVTQIPGLSVYLVLQLISEVGTDLSRWPSEKHSASWLGLAGGRKQSGKRKGRVKAHRNCAGRMFCAAAAVRWAAGLGSDFPTWDAFRCPEGYAESSRRASAKIPLRPGAFA